MPLDLRTISDQVVEDVDDDVVVGDGVDLRPRELHVDQDPLHRRHMSPRTEQEEECNVRACCRPPYVEVLKWRKDSYHSTDRRRRLEGCGGFPWPGFIPSLVAVPPVLPAETETGVRGRGRLIHL